jgi:hypothetical protein
MVEVSLDDRFDPLLGKRRSPQSAADGLYSTIGWFDRQLPNHPVCPAFEALLIELDLCHGVADMAPNFDEAGPFAVLPPPGEFIAGYAQPVGKLLG